MALAIALSLFFGFMAALALAVCAVSFRRGWRAYRAIRAEQALMDRLAAPVPGRANVQFPPRPMAAAAA